MKEMNRKRFGLSLKFANELTLPKARTKEWLKVLTIEQIMKRKSNFSTSEKIHYMLILKKALEKKLQTLQKLRYQKQLFKRTNIGIVVEKKIGNGLLDTFYEFVEFRQLKPDRELTREERLRKALEEYRTQKQVKRELKEKDLESADDEDSESADEASLIEEPTKEEGKV